jgi:ribosomal protein S18 acetylase RimI-like enzyme
MTEYRTLDKASFETIHKSFVEAFSDYIVRVALTPEQLRGMNVLRGVDYSASLGAFEAGELIGFTLNGIGLWNGRLTAYDAGTAVLKEFRGRGISTEMFSRLRPLLKGLGVERYLLEVITSNEGACRLYRKLGFKVNRRLDCLKLKPGALRAAGSADALVKDIPPADWPALRPEMEKDASFRPSWQNSWDSILRLPENFEVKGVWRGGELAGCGVVATASGSIPQLWVKKERRRSGLGSALLCALAQAARTKGGLGWLNIDEQAADTLKFLEACGFERGLSQYEMEMEL